MRVNDGIHNNPPAVKPTTTGTTTPAKTEATKPAANTARPLHTDAFDTSRASGGGALPHVVQNGLHLLGLKPNDLERLGHALPHLISAGNALSKNPPDLQTAFGELKNVSQAAPELTARLGKAITDHVPQGVKNELGKLNLSEKDFAQAGAALPHVIKAAEDLSRGDWHGALDQAKAVGSAAPDLTNRIGQAILDKVPQSVKDQVGKLGLNGQNLQELGAALPHAIGAANALEHGDWQAALGELKGVGQAAPELTNKLGQAILNHVPQSLKDQVGKLGITGQQLSEAGAALPHVLGAANALSHGDWQTALSEAKGIGQAAPELTGRLGKAIVDHLPQGLKDQVGKLGLSGKDVQELGAAAPHVLGAVQDLAKGDWKGALSEATSIGQAAPELTNRLGSAILNHVPQNVKDQLGKLGVNGQNLSELGAAAPHVFDAASAIGKGDWQGALNQLGAIHDSAPHLVEGLGKAIVDHMPQGLKDELGKLGVNNQNLSKLGKSLPDAVNLVDSLKSGNYGGALASVDKLTGDISPALRSKLGGAVEKALGLPEGGLTDALAQGKTVGFGNMEFGKSYGNLNGKGLVGPDGIKAGNPLANLGATDIPIASGSWQAGGSLYSAQGSWGKPGGPLYAQGSVNFGQAVVAANGEVHADLKNLQLGASGRVAAGIYAVNAQGQVQANYGWGSTSLQGHALVGAEAQAEGAVKIDPLHGTAMAHVDADAFAGARADVKLQQTVGPVGAEADAAVEAGIGAHFGADVGFQKGKFNFKFDIGACLGIGFDLKLGFSVDFGKLAHEVGSVVKGAAHAVTSAVKDAGKAVSWLGNKVADGAKAVGHAVADGAKAVGHAVASGAKSVWHALTSW